MDQAQLQKLLGGAAGTPVPQVDPEDVRAVWKLGQEVEKDHPGVNVGIGVEIFERACKPEREGMCEEYIPGTIKSNFLCSIGYGDPTSVRPRAPRLDFAEVCHVL
jgi:hypothetical protein